MKRSIRNKIFFSFAGVSALIIVTLVITVSWQLHKNTSEQADLLAGELTSRAFATVEGYNAIATSILDNVREDVRRYRLSISQSSPIAVNFVRQQEEGIVEFLQTSATRADIDFVLIFNIEGELQASSGGSKGYRPGDLNLPPLLQDYSMFSSGLAVNDLLKKEISYQISPQEAVEQEKQAAQTGFVRLDRDFLTDLGIDAEGVSEKGALALVDTGIIRDDFFVPVGSYIAGKLINDFNTIFYELHEVTHVATSLYIDTTPVTFAGFQHEKMGNKVHSLLEISPAEVARIHNNKQPTDIFLSFQLDRYLSSCSSIKDADQNRLGVLCVGLPESQIVAIQQPLLQHGLETERVLQKTIVAIGAAMIVILFVFARIFAMLITKPLEAVVDFANKVGEGAFSRRLENLPADEIGSLGRAINVMLDNLDNTIREKEKIEARLYQAQKMEAVGTMAGGIAHDFNNILTIISGNAEIAFDDVPADNPARENIEEIFKASRRAGDLVSQILAFSRKEKKELIPMRPQLLIKEGLKLLRSTTPTTISIVQKISQDCRMIKADPTALHQVLMNLFTNAVHSMDEKGEVTISLNDVTLDSADLDQFATITPIQEKPTGSYVRLSVTDEGTGMDKGIINRIFDPFFTTKEVGKGTGMGLSVVHGIVESHGGFIAVDSEPGRGTSIHVFFPVIEKEEELPLEVKTTTNAKTGTERIFIIDDEESLLHLAKRMLENLGYEVKAESSSIKALEIFKSNPDRFDLIISDQSMPNLSGAELAAGILQERPGMLIILCTGYSSKISEKTAREKGIAGFIQKPYNKKALAKIVREVLDGKA